ncbi:hypothetical protein KAX02_06430 [candidate division WOR-3 bacterium]|nr:hypothetical protein [candidate division WOR-3 bacterium]
MKSREGIKDRGTRKMVLKIGELKRLMDAGIIDKDAYQKAIPLVEEREGQEKRLDIYNNQSGELCVVFGYRQRKWYIRVPLFYTIWDFIKLKYPLDTGVANAMGQKPNTALWRELNRNRVKLDELDKKRKIGIDLGV